VLDVANIIAEVKGCTLEEVAATTTKQALQLFDLE
jgi:TatD DNase family protein